MRRRTLLILGLIVLFYFALHLPVLQNFPVFADEAIYIRWAQLIIDDSQQYLFFAMNDGKTPLFIWLLVPFLKTFSDPLFAARLVSVIIGGIQVLAVGWVLRILKLEKRAVYVGMILTSLLPFWYIHHRLALMDGLLTLGITIAYVGVIKIIQTKTGKEKTRSFIKFPTYLRLLKFYLKDKQTVVAISILGFGLALAFWSKLPAVLAIPTFFLPTLFVPDKQIHERLEDIFKILIGLSIGTLAFLVLRIHPSFGQLFSRGSDFLYPFNEVIFHGMWKETLINIPTYIDYFVRYLSPAFLILIFIGLFAPYKRYRTHMLLWSGVLFIFPIALLGRVVYPRYLFPSVLFITLAGASALDSILRSWITVAKTKTQSGTRLMLVAGMVISLLLANIVIGSLQFIQLHLTDFNGTPFVSADREQYLTRWSSGHGIRETAELIKSIKDSQSIAVATEGHFGTLPDGMLLYFHNQDVSNLYIEGIGQPVESLPEAFVKRAQEYDQTWLVVNSHRLRATLPSDWLVAEYCRPFAAPCLQVWDISQFVDTYSE